MVACFLIVAMLSACRSQPQRSQGERADVVVVALDTVRWDHTSLAGYARDTTPRLAALAASGGAVTFERAYTAAAWSLPAYASLFTGRDAVSHGLGFSRNDLDPSHRTLAEILSAYGYQSAAFTSGPHLHPVTTLDRGFATYTHDLPPTSLSIQVDRALDWMTTASEDAAPLFAFVQGYDAHVPYPAPPEYAEHYDPDYQGTLHPPSVPPGACGEGRGPDDVCVVPLAATEGRVRRLRDGGMQRQDFEHARAHYDGAIRYADAQLGRLLDGMDALGILDSAVVVVLADHGEALGEVGRFGHDDQYGDKVFHVPLVVRLPGGREAARWPGLVSLTGLVPTLADVLEIVPPAAIDGRSFAGALDGSAAPAEAAALSASMCCYSVRTAEWEARGWRNPRQLKAPMQWSLHRGGEDVTLLHPDVLTSLRQELAGWPAHPEDVHAFGHGAASRRDFQEALREGGYWTRTPEHR